MSRFVPPTSSNTILSGLGKVIFSPDGTEVKVTLTQNLKDNEGNWTHKTEEFYLLRSNCPGNLTPGYYSVRLNGKPKKEREMLSFYPADGVYTVQFSKFPSKEDEAPAPRTNSGKFGEYKTFMALVKIFGGDYSGCEIPVYLTYNFAPYPLDNGKYGLTYSKSIEKSDPTKFLDTFLGAIGVWDNGPLPYSDNVLPMLQKIALKKSAKFKVVLADGRAVSFRTDVMDDDNTAWKEGEAWGEDTTPEPEFSDPDVVSPAMDLESDEAWEDEPPF